MREGYYRDLACKLAVERRLWGSNDLCGKVDLSGLGLKSVFPHAQFLAFAEEVDLSGNDIETVEGFAGCLVSCQRLDLSGNDIKGIEGFEKLMYLKSVNVKGNPVRSDPEKVEALKSKLDKVAVIFE